MIKNIPVAILALATLLQGSPLTYAANADSKDWTTDFASPPDSAQPHTWWHWMNGNVSREGITADLEAMKRVGIHSATIVTDCSGPPPGNVKFLSSDWLGMVKFAAQEANRLGMNLGVENCEGWSSSGGPWVTPAGSMQKVVWTTTVIPGGQTFGGVLPRPEANDGYYDDIAILAMPVPAAEAMKMTDFSPTASTSTSDPQARNLIDGDPATTVQLPIPHHIVIQKALYGYLADPAHTRDVTKQVQALVDQGNVDIPGNQGGGDDVAPGFPKTLSIEYTVDDQNLKSSVPDTNSITLTPSWMQVAFPKPFTAHVATLTLGQPGGSWHGKLQCSDDGQNFRSIGDLDATHLTLMFPPTTGRYFRVAIFGGNNPDSSSLTVAGLDLSPGIQLIPDIDVKTFSKRDDATNFATMPATFPDAPPGTTIASNSIVDLTTKMDKDGKLTWDAPPGQWLVIRFGHTTNEMTNHPGDAEGGGLECDKLSRAAAQAYWDGIMPKVQAALGPLWGTTFDHTLIDSYEVGCQNWTTAFPEEFRKRCGYDILPYLPVLTGRVVESRQVSERFLWDFRRTIADLFAENYYDYFEVMCRHAGIKLEVEPYGSGPFEELRCARDTDHVMAEFWWPNAQNMNDIMNAPRVASSTAHTYGKSFVGAEAFTAWKGNWLMCPPNMKALGDLAFINGINSFTFHRYAHQPWLNRWPGMTMGEFGSNIERTNNWWEPGAAWLQYLARCNLLLRKGLYVADLLFSDGEGVPQTPPTIHVKDGYDFDSCSYDVLLNRLSVKNGRLTLPDGMSYRVLVLEPSTTMTPALLHKLKELTDGGASIIGAKPIASPSLVGYPQCDAEVKKLSDELWDSGKIISGKTGEDVLASLGVKPDFECSSLTPLRYIHRVSEGTDFYFISNQQEIDKIADCTFRVAGKTPELWHPDTGKIEKIALYTEMDGRTRLSLHLDPIGSVFVVFRPNTASTDHPISVTLAAPETPTTPNELVINRAIYGDANEVNTMDVTAFLNSKIKNGDLSFQVNNDFFGNDPAHSVAKQLKIDYTFNGREVRKTFDENDTFSIAKAVLPCSLDYGEKGTPNLEAWQEGTYTIQTAAGKTITKQIPTLANWQEITGPWDLDFPPNWGAPAHATFDKLISWSDAADSGVKYFSGTATYHKTIQIPAALIGQGHRLYLDLGEVEVMASVKLNGSDLGVLWKPPYRVEITPLAKAGDNTLDVKVTNLWPNRLIGDEQLPEDCDWNANGSLKSMPQWVLDGKPSPTGRFTFATWKQWHKNDKLLPSGLIGPVTLIPSVEVPVP